MHVSGPRSIKALQTQSMAYRQQPKDRHEPAGYQPAMCESNWRPRLCQFIAGHPTRSEIRRRGADQFKCGKPVKLNSSYCDECHAKCFKPLTNPEEQAGSDE